MRWETEIMRATAARIGLVLILTSVCIEKFVIYLRCEGKIRILEVESHLSTFPRSCPSNRSGARENNLSERLYEYSLAIPQHYRSLV